jgi:molecular chaperone DnaK
MSSQGKIVFGIDLGTTYSCIAYVDEFGKSVVIPNSEGDRTTPSVVQFEGENRIVGKEAKNSAVLAPDEVVAFVKRQMGLAGWRWNHDGKDFTAEEISSYILRKLADDAEQQLGFPVEEVVITCPAYFGISEREATARAGEIARLNVREVINEPTAAAIMYGMQNEQDRVVLVYDLGGGTFDITVIEIKQGTITVVATGGDHHLGGRDWDERVVDYLAQQWMNDRSSSDDPRESQETLQDLWGRAETAKRTLSSRQETNILVSHAGQRAGVTLSRDKFNEITNDLLNRTIDFTHETMNEARSRGFQRFDQILLVGGSTRMPQVSERLKVEFSIPLKVLEPDEAVAKGAAIYGQKLEIDEKIQIRIAELTGTATSELDIARVSPRVIERAQNEVARASGLRVSTVKQFNELEVTNVASHSFGVVVVKGYVHGISEGTEYVENLIFANDPLPAAKQETFCTLYDNQTGVRITVMENIRQDKQIEDLTLCEKIGEAILPLPPLPENSPIEISYALNNQGRLHVTGHEPSSHKTIEADIETDRGISKEELRDAKKRSSTIVVS